MLGTCGCVHNALLHPDRSRVCSRDGVVDDRRNELGPTEDVDDVEPHLTRNVEQRGVDKFAQHRLSGEDRIHGHDAITVPLQIEEAPTGMPPQAEARIAALEQRVSELERIVETFTTTPP